MWPPMTLEPQQVTCPPMPEVILFRWCQMSRHADSPAARHHHKKSFYPQGGDLAQHMLAEQQYL